jgi:Tfp pilus assembly protein PilO
MTLWPMKSRLDLRNDVGWIAVVLGALLALNLGFYLLLNLPRLRALQQLESGGGAARRTLRMAGERVQTMRDLIHSYDDETLKIADFYTNRVGTQAERMTTIQKEVRAIAEEFRIDPEAIDYNVEPAQGSDLLRFQISIPLVGGYANLRQFINRVEGSPHLLLVDEIQLTGAKEGGAMLSLTIRISTYFRTPGVEGKRPPAERT